MKINLTINELLTIESKLAPVRSVSFGKKFSQTLSRILLAIDAAKIQEKKDFEAIPEVVAFNTILQEVKDKTFKKYPSNDYEKNIKIVDEISQKAPEFASYVKANEDAQKKTVIVEIEWIDEEIIPDNISADQYRAISIFIK